MPTYTVTIQPDDGHAATTVISLEVNGAAPRITRLELIANDGASLSTAQLPEIDLEMCSHPSCPPQRRPPSRHARPLRSPPTRRPRPPVRRRHRREAGGYHGEAARGKECDRCQGGQAA